MKPASPREEPELLKSTSSTTYSMGRGTVSAPDELVQAVHDAYNDQGHSLMTVWPILLTLDAVPDGWAKIDGGWRKLSTTKKAGRNMPQTQPTLSGPAQVRVNELFEVTGSGYDPKLQTWIRVLTPSTAGWLSATTNPDGTIRAVIAVAEPCTADVASFQDDGRKSRRPKGTPTLAQVRVVVSS